MSVQSPTKVDLSKYLEVRIFGERPHIRGRRVPVAMIVYTAQGNKWGGGEETAYQFSLSEAEVLAALLHYEENQDEIDRQEVEEQAKFAEILAATQDSRDILISEVKEC